MNRAVHYMGSGATAASLSLIYVEKANNSAQGIIGGLAVTVIIGGCILVGFADKKGRKNWKTIGHEIIPL